LDAGALANILSYTAPAMNGFTFSASLTDATAAGGMESSSTAADGRTVGVAYAAGPLAARLDTTRQSQNSAPDASVKSRTRLSASYDLGVAKLGFGYQTRKSFESGADTNKQTLIGAAVPVAGNITVGLNYAQMKEGDGKIKGTTLGVKYDLSKRTYIAFHTLRNKATDTPADGKFTAHRIQVSHAF